MPKSRRFWVVLTAFMFIVTICVLSVLAYTVWRTLGGVNDQATEQHYQRAIACEQSGDWNCAVTEYEATIALRPNYEDAATRLGAARQHRLEMHYQRGVAFMESTEIADLQRAIAESEIAYAIAP